MAKKQTLTKRLRALAKSQSFAQRLSLIAFILAFAGIGSYIITRSSAAGAPDLVVTSVTTSPASPSSGQQVTFSAVIKNQGTQATPGGTVLGVGFSLNGNRISGNSSYTQSLAVGASVTLSSTTTWTASSGPYTLEAFADENNLIPNELNEGNNKLSKGLTIGNTGNLYLIASAPSVFINNNFTVDVRINPGIAVDGIDADVTYNPAELSLVSFDSANSAFEINFEENTATAGTISLIRGNLQGGVSTDSFIGRATFKALKGSGSSQINISGNATTFGVYTNPTINGTVVNLETPDTTAPTVTITSPTAGEAIFSTKTLSANATDNVAVTKVEFWIDGQLIATDNSSPYSYTIDSTTLANGSHTLQVKGFDAAGNVGTTSRSFSANNRNEDINIDGVVNILDFSILASKFGQSGSNLGRADINRDGSVNILDFSRLAQEFGK